MRPQILTLDHEAKVKLQKELYQSLSSIEVRATPPPELPRRKNTVPSMTSTKLSDSFVDTLIDLSFDSTDCKFVCVLAGSNAELLLN